MPEATVQKSNIASSASNTAVLGGRGREVLAAFDKRRRETINNDDESKKRDGATRSTEEKQQLLGKHLSNVEDLVQDLRDGGELFGGDV